MHELLRKHKMKVTFVKKDESIRVMKCTLIPDLLPPVSGSGDREGITTVFDLEKGQWRCFRDDSVLSYEIIE